MEDNKIGEEIKTTSLLALKISPTVFLTPILVEGFIIAFELKEDEKEIVNVEKVKILPRKSQMDPHEFFKNTTLKIICNDNGMDTRIV